MKKEIKKVSAYTDAQTARLLAVAEQNGGVITYDTASAIAEELGKSIVSVTAKLRTLEGVEYVRKPKTDKAGRQSMTIAAMRSRICAALGQSEEVTNKELFRAIMETLEK